ncbi:MAG: RNA polymerase sigma factor [Candidatus Latescibacteria bacterium]|nr:RNA polymerase sigma factor [Candidatus Latescibacterota bacterium]
MTDNELMLAVRGGDIDKLGQLFETHHKRLYNFFRQHTGNRQASEDLVQEVFLRMLKYRHTYKGDGNFESWMYGITRNARIDYYREHSVEYVDLEETGNLIRDTPGPEESFSQKSDIAVLQRALLKLPEDKRELLVMSRFNNMRYKEIGKILGCTVGAVKVRMYRAMKELTDTFMELTGGGHHEM